MALCGPAGDTADASHRERRGRPRQPLDGEAPLNIAHQGGAKEAPSNTLFAFKEADKLGADVLELDVHATSDGELVVIHDTTVDRTTDGSGRVDQMTLEDIKALRPIPGTLRSRSPSHSRASR